MKTDNQNEKRDMSEKKVACFPDEHTKLTGDNLPTESIEQAAERLYPSNPVIIDENITIDANLILRKEWINGADWQKSQPDNRVVIKDDFENLLCEKATSLQLPKVQIERFVEGGEFVLSLLSTTTQSITSKLEERIKELEEKYNSCDTLECEIVMSAINELTDLLNFIKGE